ncbi:unnamed protein product [Amaranthus hypochondriacus]
MASSSSSSNQEREVNQELWQACAGVDVDVPKLNSLVYYFPKDHFDHSSSSLDEFACGSFLCRVTNVSFHANPQTDQVFVKFLLQPCNIDDPSKNPDPNPNPNPIQNQIHNNATFTLVKVLSMSDIQDGLFVTKALGDNIFSKLPQNPPEIIRWIDVHGKIWNIMLQLKDGKLRRCCYAGGWCNFAKIKNLTPRDSIVFLLNKSTNECHVGIRRAVINRPISGKDIKDAIKKAQEMKSFEVVYYPIVGFPEFVVSKVKVDNARRIVWRCNMPVMFPCEFGGLGPIKQWHNGRLLNIKPLKWWHNWPDSWWRVLEVEWLIDSEILEEKPHLQKNMSPWELYVLPSDQVSGVPTTSIMEKNTSCSSSYT